MHKVDLKRTDDLRRGDPDRVHTTILAREEMRGMPFFSIDP